MKSMTMNVIPVNLLLALFLVMNAHCNCSAGDATQGVLHGIITDINGKAVTGAVVYAYTTSDVKRPGDFISKTTLQDGHYQLTFPAGTFWVVARERQGSSRFGPLHPSDRHSGDPQKIDIKAGMEKQMDFTIANIMEAARLQPKKRDDLVKVEGKIVNALGNPVPMAYVAGSRHQKPAEFPEYLSGWTDNAGTYAIFLPKGEYFLGSVKKFPPPEGLELDKKVRIDLDTGSINLQWKD